MGFNPSNENNGTDFMTSLAMLSLNSLNTDGAVISNDALLAELQSKSEGVPAWFNPAELVHRVAVGGYFPGNIYSAEDAALQSATTGLTRGVYEGELALVRITDTQSGTSEHTPFVMLAWNPTGTADGQTSFAASDGGTGAFELATPKLAARGLINAAGNVMTQCTDLDALLAQVKDDADNTGDAYNKDDIVVNANQQYSIAKTNTTVDPYPEAQGYSSAYNGPYTRDQLLTMASLNVCGITRTLADWSNEGGMFGNTDMTPNGLANALWNTVKQYFPKGITVNDSGKTLIPALKAPIYFDGNDIALGIDKGLVVSGGKLNANVKSPIVFDSDGKMSWEDALGSDGQVWAKDGGKYKPVTIVVGTGNSGGTPPYLSAGNPKIQLPGLVDPNGKIWVQGANAWKTPYYGTPTNYQPQINSLAARVTALENAPSSSGVSALTGCTVLGGIQFQNPVNSILWAYCGSSNTGQRPLGYDGSSQDYFIARIK